MAAQYTTLRLMDFTDTNGNLTSNWSDRTVPGDNFWTGWTILGGSGVATGDDRHRRGAGVPWEVCVALANETGKDLYINIPSNASIEYIDNLADLFAYGSNGVNPYTSPQANPVWPPLNSNLKVYIEFSNEIWNSRGFTQAGTGGQRLVQPTLAAGGLRLPDGQPKRPAVSGRRRQRLQRRGDHRPAVHHQRQRGRLSGHLQRQSRLQRVDVRRRTSPTPTPRSTAIDIYQGWVAPSPGADQHGIQGRLRRYRRQRQRHGEPRAAGVRVAIRRQVGRRIERDAGHVRVAASGRLLPLRRRRRLVCRRQSDHGFDDTEFANCDFTTPVVSGYQQAPAGASFTFNGAAGMAANGSSLGNPTAPTEGPTNAPTGSTQTAYMQPGASISQSVDFSGGWADITLFASQTSSSYNYGLTISIDGGAALELSEGGAGYSGSTSSSSQWGWDRTAAFNVTAGYHTVTFTNTSSSGRHGLHR